jgi:hypothetical protein
MLAVLTPASKRNRRRVISNRFDILFFFVSEDFLGNFQTYGFEFLESLPNGVNQIGELHARS